MMLPSTAIAIAANGLRRALGLHYALPPVSLDALVAVTTAVLATRTRASVLWWIAAAAAAGALAAAS